MIKETTKLHCFLFCFFGVRDLRFSLTYAKSAFGEADKVPELKECTSRPISGGCGGFFLFLLLVSEQSDLVPSLLSFFYSLSKKATLVFFFCQ